MSKKELVEQDLNEIIDFDPSIFAEDANEDTGMSQDDFLIPRLKVLQGLSPQADRTSGDYIEGAVPGDIFNTVTEEVWKGDEGMILIPVYYQRTYIEWKPDRGGFVEDRGLDEALAKTAVYDEKEKKPMLPNGNLLVETCNHYVLVYNPESGTATPAIMSMSGSQVRVAKRWNSYMNQLQRQNPQTKTLFNPAPFFCAYRFSTIIQEKDKNRWFVFDYKLEDDLIKMKNGGQVYSQARGLRKQIVEGEVAAQPVEEDDGQPSDAI